MTIENALILIIGTVPGLAALWYLNQKGLWYTGKRHDDVVEAMTKGWERERRALIEARDGKTETIAALTAELAEVRRVRDERERTLAREADDRVAYVEQRRLEERERARDAERLVAAFTERFGTVASMAERLASVIDGISGRLQGLLDKLDRRTAADA